MLKAAPDPVDVQELQFKLQSRIKIFSNTDSARFSQHCSLITTASRFGLIFIGSQAPNIQAIQIKDIEKYTKNDGDIVNYARRNLPLSSSPYHLSVNCEHTLLAIVIERDGRPCALFYDVKSFWQQEIVQVGQVWLSLTPGVYITEINWNPALASMFTACKSDGTLGIYDIKNTGVDVNELPAASGATCFCWSPKGKQIAVGSKDGKITQLKPDLKAVKVINAPPLKELHILQSLQWVSNYQFIGVFQPINPDAQVVFIVIDSPKSGDSTYIRYDDICYSNGNTRSMQFYTILLQPWNVLMAASSNSMEVGILGNVGECWTQWIMGDASRAELPLTANHQETLPIGCALSTGSTQPLLWGESTLPPMPLLLLLSHHGILCCFNVVNLKQGVPNICTPPDALQDMSGLKHFGTVGTDVKNDSAITLKGQTNLTSVENSKIVVPCVTISNVSATVPKAQPQVSITQALNFSRTPAINLFGGQATLTPITQINKGMQSSFVTQHQHTFPPVGCSEGKPTTPTIQIPTCATSVIVKPVVSATSETTAVSIIKPSQEEPREGLNKAETIAVQIKEEEEADKLFAEMVREECIFLESELKAILHQGRNLKFKIGSDNDKTNIIESTKSLQDFVHEVVEICVSQNSEVHILKQNTLQSWAWYEETKSRHLTLEDDSLLMLRRSQPLDSASQKQQTDIQHSNYYLESQLSQAHLALDEQWENFQDYCKETHKLQIPTMEIIFQTMVKQNAILRKQSYILKDITSRIKKKSRSAVGPSLLISVNDVKGLPDELKRLRMNSEDICQIQYEHVTNRMKSFTETRVNNLRSFLKTREYSRISALKPQMATSVIQASPSSKLKLYNSLTSKTPSILQEFSPKELNFVQSTPKTVSCTQGKTAIENLQNFAIHFDTRHFSKPNDKTFTPLIKSIIASSPNSAFVSTSFGSNTSTSVALSSTLRPTVSGASSTTAIQTIAKDIPNSATVKNTAEGHEPILIGASGSFTKLSMANSVVLPRTSGSILKASTSNSEMQPAIISNVETTSTLLMGTSNTNANANKTLFPTFSTINTKPNAGSNLKITKSPAAASSVATSLKTSTSFTNTSASPFLMSSPSNIFGIATQKSDSPSMASTKTFVFSSKSTTTTADAENPLLPKLLNPNTIPSTQSMNFNTTDSNFTTPSTVNTSKSGVSVTLSTVPPTFASVTTTSLLGSSTPPSIFGSNAITSIRSTTGSLSEMKPSLFTSVSPVTTNGSIVVRTMAVPCTSVVATNSPSFTTVAVGVNSSLVTTTSSTFDDHSTLSKSSLFSSNNVTNVGSLNLTSTPGFIVANTPSNNSLTLGSNITTTSQPSIFEGSATSNAPTIFGNSTTQSIFATTTVSTSLGPSTTQSIFASTLPTSASVATPTTSTIQASIFATPSSRSASFGLSIAPTSQVSVFHTTSPTSTTLGTSTTSATQSPTFGVVSSTPTCFGLATTSTTQIFATALSTPTTSLFGVSTSTISQSIFDSGTTNQTSVFGGAVTSTTSQSIFGNPPTATTSQSFGLFRDSSENNTIFGNAPANTNQPSVFGNSNQSSVFGNTASSANSIFSQNRTSNAFGQSVFAPSSSSNTFGNSTFGQSSGSLFGNAPTTTTTGSIFGETTKAENTFSSSGTVFGTPSSNAASPFGSTNIFSSNTTQSSSFSTNTNVGSFGFGNLNVGSTTTTSSSDFGSASTANPFGGDNKNIFGSLPAPTGNSAFGSNSGSVFGAPSSSFGSNFGSQPSFAQQTPFAPSSFGNSSFASSSSGPFSSGSTGSVGQTGFGTSSNFQKPGFGSSPVFGGSPSFGNTPSFGGAPAFGNPATFGSPTSKVFGSTNSGFNANSNNSQGTGFGTLANQPTVGFGNLAQQAANPAGPNAPFSGNSSFSSWR